MHHQSTDSTTPTTAGVIKIWTIEADQLASPSTYKYKVQVHWGNHWNYSAAIYSTHKMEQDKQNKKCICC